MYFSSNIYSSVPMVASTHTHIHPRPRTILYLYLPVSISCRSAAWPTQVIRPMTNEWKISNRKILFAFLIKFKICSTLNCFFFLRLRFLYFSFDWHCVQSSRHADNAPPFVRFIHFHLAVAVAVVVPWARMWHANAHPLSFSYFLRVFI